jgi:hypothetical protein
MHRKNLVSWKNRLQVPWDSTKDGFAEAYKDLYDAYKDAAKKFE